MQLHKSIILVGLMGCGKSSIGKKLAAQLEVPFSDMDQVIEEQVGCTISDIFKHKGEPYFREVELSVAKDLLAQSPHIIATGGGAFMNPTLRQYIQSHAVSVWLKASFEVLHNRVKNKTHRPLLETGDKATILKTLMDERYPIYEQADIVIESTNAAHKIVVQKIVNALTLDHIIEEK